MCNHGLHIPLEVRKVIPNQIERDILIEAPVEVVWRTVTEPDQITSWFSDAAEIDAREGGEGTLTWSGRATSKPMTVRISVETVEPPHTFSFRWLHPEGVEAREDNSLLVEFSLTPEGEHTRLRVVETGLAAHQMPDEQKATYADEHGRGWETHLAALRTHVARQRGVPSSR
jgi:uncharacterized protein YndB with AHSA1/START domain